MVTLTNKVLNANCFAFETRLQLYSKLAQLCFNTSATNKQQSQIERIQMSNLKYNTPYTEIH